MADERPFLSVPEVAEILGYTRVRAWQLCRDGRIPHIRQGNRILIPRAAWNSWLREQSDRALAGVNRS